MELKRANLAKVGSCTLLTAKLAACSFVDGDGLAAALERTETDLEVIVWSCGTLLERALMFLEASIVQYWWLYGSGYKVVESFPK